MNEPLTLTVTTDFFTSEFLPDCCVFTGRPGPLRKFPVRVIYHGYEKSDWWKPRDSVGLFWQATIQMPSSWRAQFVQSLMIFLLWFAGFFAVLFGFVFVGFISMLMGPGLGSDWTRLLVVGGIWSSCAGLWFFARFQLRRRTWFVAQAQQGEVKIIFPPHCRVVFEAYSAGWKSYVLAGQPKPAKKEKDEGWEDGVRPGWDGGKP